MIKCNLIPELTDRQLRNLWPKIDVRGPDECWEWTAERNHRGYGRVKLNKVRYSAHRIAYKLAKGDPGNLFVCHSCDNPKCCNPNHLWLGTQADNVHDCVKKGRLVDNRGERSGNHILTERQVRAIKAALIPSVFGVSKLLAQKYGVSPQLICDIKAGRRWRHVHA